MRTKASRREGVRRTDHTSATRCTDARLSFLRMFLRRIKQTSDATNAQTFAIGAAALLQMVRLVKRRWTSGAKVNLRSPFLKERDED